MRTWRLLLLGCGHTLAPAERRRTRVGREARPMRRPRLPAARGSEARRARRERGRNGVWRIVPGTPRPTVPPRAEMRAVVHAPAYRDAGRSEEHTSELQSRENHVC